MNSVSYYEKLFIRVIKDTFRRRTRKHLRKGRRERSRFALINHFCVIIIKKRFAPVKRRSKPFHRIKREFSELHKR